MKQLSRKAIDENKEVVLDLLTRQLQNAGYSNINTYEKDDKTFIFLRNTTKQDLGHIETIVDTTTRRINTLIFGSTQHTITIFRATEELPSFNFVFYIVTGDIPDDRKERYSILNKISNFLYDEYNVNFAKLDKSHIGTISTIAIELPEEVPVKLEDDTGEMYEFKLLMIKNEGINERYKKVFLKQLISRAIRKKLREKGYFFLGPTTAMNFQSKRDIGKITIYSGLSYDVFLFSRTRVGLAIKPLNRVITRVSLFDYLNRDIKAFMLYTSRLIGRTAYLENFSNRGVIRKVYFPNTSEYKRILEHKEIGEEDSTESPNIPIIEIISNGEKIYKLASDIMVSFTTYDGKRDKDLREYFKAIQKAPATTLTQAKTYIQEISPIIFSNFVIHFSTEPMEVFLE